MWVCQKNEAEKSKTEAQTRTQTLIKSLTIQQEIDSQNKRQKQETNGEIQYW